MSATLQGAVRDQLGSRPARKLRAAGRIPGNLVGEGKDPLAFSIDEDEFLAARRHHEHLFDIELGGDIGSEAAIVRELQWDSMGDSITHVEFLRVVRGRKMQAEVELSFVGHPKGGVLNHLLTHVTVECIPSKIPDTIEVNADGLEIGHPLLAKDLELPDEVDLALDPETPVAVVATVRAVEEDTPADEEGEEGAAPAAGEPAPEPGGEG